MLPGLLSTFVIFSVYLLYCIHCGSPYLFNRHPAIPPDMSPVYVVGMLGILMKVAMPMCVPTEYTIYIERQECNYCVAVNTTICMGFCFSRVSEHSEEKWRCTGNWIQGEMSQLAARQADLQMIILLSFDWLIDWSYCLVMTDFCGTQTEEINVFPLNVILFWVPQKNKGWMGLEIYEHD